MLVTTGYWWLYVGDNFRMLVLDANVKRWRILVTENVEISTTQLDGVHFTPNLSCAQILTQIADFLSKLYDR